MTELRFHRDLYSDASVAQAVSTFERYATIARADEPSHFVVRVTSESVAREKRVAGELGNFALGTTVRDRGAR